MTLKLRHRHRDMEQGIDPGLSNALAYLQTSHTALATETLCYEQLALNFYADSLLVNKTYGDVTAYSTGLVEEDATLLAPFARKCYSLQSVYHTDGVQKRIEAEQVADSSFYHQNVQRRFYVALPEPIRPKKHWPFVKRNARRLTIAHHITLGEKIYVRLHLSRGGGKGETILVVFDQAGHAIEHCSLSYDYLSSQFYK